MRSELTRVLRQQPFVPFTIFANDGRVFDINHVDFCLITKNAAYVYREDGDELTRLSFAAITSIGSKEPAQ